MNIRKLLSVLLLYMEGCESILQTTGAVPASPANRALFPKDCTEVQFQGHSKTGLYPIQPKGAELMVVQCDLESDGGGWTIFQSQHNGSSDFDRTWNEYKSGFGKPGHDFWLGLENLHILTKWKKRPTELRIDLWDFDG